MGTGVEITATAIPDLFQLTPTRLLDNRGEFFEFAREGALSEVIGYPFLVRQVNYSVSSRGTLRGIHATMVPPGQAKLVTCVKGAVLDIVVDLRYGSPTYGEHVVTHQDAESGIGLYMADGLGHAFLALTDDTRMCYMVSEEWVPGTMVEVDALDPELALPWPITEPPIRSVKDVEAYTLAGAEAAGVLASYAECQAWYAKLRESR